MQIIRDGKEIAALSSLRSFEYGYQFSKNLDQVKLLPGDKFITTCDFDTSNDTQPVPGGLPSTSEMCFAWVDYYPANEVLACTQVNLGESPRNPINGTAAMCLEASKDESDGIYPSDFLTASFQNLTASGNMCPASDNSGNSPSNSNGTDAAVLRTCPATDICFAVNVPEASKGSESGDIFFQLSAPTSYSWVALAQGTAMSNANMFLMHSSADGLNVTLSARSTSGHVMPTHNDAADVTLMAGSGISNGRMIANVKCTNCNSWSTGSMSLQDDSSNWLYAYRQGTPINSDDKNAAISEHDNKGTFQWDLSTARGGSSPNPFTATATTTNFSSSATGWRAMSAQAQDRFVQAHGALASIAFVAIFPIGGILVRLASASGLVWIHGGLQIFGYTIFIAAAGIGIYIATSADYMHEPHAIIGVILLIVLFFMPIIGVIHHKMYARVHRRTLWSYGHIFTGRAAIVLGMVNGGLGLQLSGASRSSTIAYGVTAGVMGLIYIVAIVFGELKRSRGSYQTAATNVDVQQREHKGSGRDTSEEHSLS